MPKTPFQNPFSSNSSSDNQGDEVVGRDAATELARQKTEEAYSTSPPNKEAEETISQTSEKGELRIEHEEKDEPEEISTDTAVDTIERDNTQQNNSSESATPEKQEEAPKESASSVYDRSHDDNAAYASAAKQWQSYHSSWQQYYQQYYERYYLSQMRSKESSGAQPGDVSSIISSENKVESSATSDIRSQLLSKAQERAKAVKKSRHFMPIVTALAVGILFTFLQYNRLLVAQVQAYISPGNINPQNIIVDPNENVKVGPESKLIIPKINVEAPLIFDINSYNEPAVQEALKKGVVDYPIPGANARPGQVGNMPILGHSSNDVFDDGAYKFVFVQLSQLNEGDTFFIHYNSVRYTYSVTGKEIIDPKEVSKLAIKTDVPMVTLITCEPPGTVLKRLIVFADQVSPDPTEAKKPAASEDPQQKPKEFSGNSPTVLERLFR